ASGAGNINTLVDLPNQATVIFTLVGTVAPGTTGAISNTATVSPPAGVTDPALADNSSTLVDGATQNADLQLTKTASPAQPIAGQTLTYTLIAENAGPDPAPLARLVDPLNGPLSGFTWTCTPLTDAAACLSASGTGSIDAQVSLPVTGRVQF